MRSWKFSVADSRTGDRLAAGRFTYSAVHAAVDVKEPAQSRL